MATEGRKGARTDCCPLLCPHTKPVSQGLLSPDCPCWQARGGSSCRDKATSHVQGRCPEPPWHMSLLPHISEAPDLKANAGCSLGVSGAPRLLDKSLSYTPASPNPFHPFRNTAHAGGAVCGPGGVGSDTEVAVGRGRHCHPQQALSTSHRPTPGVCSLPGPASLALSSRHPASTGPLSSVSLCSPRPGAGSCSQTQPRSRRRCSAHPGPCCEHHRTRRYEHFPH